jgi:multiple sugar transport system permease protein
MPRRSWPLTVLALMLALPFLYMISVSFMGDVELLRWPPALIPRAPTIQNYVAAYQALPYQGVLLNTALLAGCVMVAQVITSAAAGYAFARIRFPGRDGVFRVTVALLTIPTILLLIPRYLLVNAVGLVDTYPGLISTELVSVWGIILMRQTFLMLPRDVEEAARLDGAGEWTLFWRVTLPLARPAVIVLAVLAFVDQWRSFLWPLLVTQVPQMAVGEVALARFHATYAGNWPYQMAAAVLVTLPVLVVGIVAQRFVMQGSPAHRRARAPVGGWMMARLLQRPSCRRHVPLHFAAATWTVAQVHQSESGGRCAPVYAVDVGAAGRRDVAGRAHRAECAPPARPATSPIPGSL